MPLPSKRDGESRENFLSRCMSDEKTIQEFKDSPQRMAVCMSKALEDLDTLSSAAFAHDVIHDGYTEAINEDNFYVPSEEEYEDWGEETEEWDVSVAKPGLWENIRKKKEREGKKYKPAKRGDKDRPDPKSWKKAKNSEELDIAESGFKYRDPKTGQIYEYERKGIYTKDGRRLIPTNASEYQGRKVRLGKPFLTPNGPKKRSVYVKNEKGNVVKVNFGDPNMKIKKSDPARRKSFRARHKCSNPGPRWKARYWS